MSREITTALEELKVIETLLAQDRRTREMLAAGFILGLANTRRFNLDETERQLIETAARALIRRLKAEGNPK